jgi:murein L,D-transpeptidase YcbB/YkuD
MPLLLPISRHLIGLLLCAVLSAAAAGATGEGHLPLSIELRQLLLQSPPGGESPLNWQELKRFYSAEHFQPVWLGPKGPNRRAALLRERLRQARREGLEPQHYQIALIDRLWAAGKGERRLRLELLLSSAFFDYARDVRSGRLDPQQVATLWKIEVDALDAVTLLRLSLVREDFAAALEALPPNHPVYQRLRQALAHYRHIASLGGWPVIPAGPSLKEGMSTPRVPLLRRRLQLEGDLPLPAALESDEYDEGLAYAVERFQVRHGLKVDGVVGRHTLAALNIPVGKRIEQIVRNMERWRWLPPYLGRRYLIVNIPAYELIAYEGREARLSMPVIIGTRERPTPVASGMLYKVVFNPYWTVPRNIALRDVIPRQRRDPDYMSSYRIRVYRDWSGGEELDPHDIDWAGVNWNNFSYMLRQDPGPKNPLGQVKFLFNNPYNVYLHDTPDDQLFAQDVRAYSSGCIRVEEPLRLASFVLAGEMGWGWGEEMAQAVIDTNLTYELPLTAPIAVYLLYLTAWVGEDGAVHFRRDIYGEDALFDK